MTEDPGDSTPGWKVERHRRQDGVPKLVGVGVPPRDVVGVEEPQDTDSVHGHQEGGGHP